ncbi:MAG TPA: glycosyltransferase family 4 protein [Pyrinomonadaceae bacterium]|nr:glycosyltransferase family 4 protein [Pyrinomonadaceae bacterium]
MNSSKYVCAFRGRRDYYQAPLALAEAELLDSFITDVYAGDTLRALSKGLPARLREKVLLRRRNGIPETRVRCLWKSTIFERANFRLGKPESLIFARYDAEYSKVAAAHARKNRSNLFLYSPYAWEAFTAPYRHIPHKVLFQFHPHPDLESRILNEDKKRFPFVRESYTEESGERLNDQLRQRNRDAWKHADLVFCASSFTRRSLLEAGAPEAKCRVVPYGIEVPNITIEAPQTFSALFVGAGSQRKGLHHLLLAWKQARLPKNSRLTLVCRNIDSGILELTKATPNVDLIRGLSHSELVQQFRKSSLFVMPSLVEGFGQVYLEALAEGCPVLGTRNTGLPDIGGEAVNTIEAGDIDRLIALLEALSRELPGNTTIREVAQRTAAEFSWLRFRQNLIGDLV